MSNPSVPPKADVPAIPGISPSGLILFLIYLIIYGVFVYLAAFNGAVISKRPFGGINLAIIYGFVLIISPLILAMIYLWTARNHGKDV